MTSPRVAAAALVAVLALSGCGTSSAPSAADAEPTAVAVPGDVAGCDSFAADGPEVPNGDTLPALSLPCLVPGEDVALDDLGDRPVLVNLWASWCAPCRDEMPLLQDAYERDGDRVGFLGVDTEDTPSAAASLLADLDVTYAHVVDRDKELLTELAAPGLPVTLAVAADGRILDRQIGQASAERLDELVSLLVADAATTP
ncbi:MAG: TlpA family protein disulfide reductase [Blastococcus sp.]|nr:TlpA family protein disulfide reductase [Blastococcus sp.]